MTVKLTPYNFSNCWLMSPFWVNVICIILLPKFSQDVENVELDWFWNIVFELGFKELIISNKLANGNTIFLNKVKIRNKTSSLRLWRCTDKTTTFLNTFILFLWLLILYMEYFIVWRLLRRWFAWFFWYLY